MIDWCLNYISKGRCTSIVTWIRGAPYCATTPGGYILNFSHGIVKGLHNIQYQESWPFTFFLEVGTKIKKFI